jgi:hypothetical protein
MVASTNRVTLHIVIFAKLRRVVMHTGELVPGWFQVMPLAIVTCSTFQDLEDCAETFEDRNSLESMYTEAI